MELRPVLNYTEMLKNVFSSNVLYNAHALCYILTIGPRKSSLGDMMVAYYSNIQDTVETLNEVEWTKLFGNWTLEFL